MALSSVHSNWNFNERSESFFNAKHSNSFFRGRKAQLHLQKVLNVAHSHLLSYCTVLCCKNLFCQTGSILLFRLPLWKLLLQKSLLLLHTYCQLHHIHSHSCFDCFHARYDSKLTQIPNWKSNRAQKTNEGQQLTILHIWCGVIYFYYVHWFYDNWQHKKYNLRITLCW